MEKNEVLEVLKNTEINEFDYEIQNLVLKTTNYDHFKFMKGNRQVLKTVVQALKQDIIEKGQLQPIIVNKNWEIIDGQHRFVAIKQALLPINFIIQDEDTINEVRAMNSIATTWTLKDHLNSRVELGDKTYVKIEQLVTKFDLHIETLLQILGNNWKVKRGSGLTHAFRNGNPVLNVEWKEAEKMCQMIYDYHKRLPSSFNHKMFQKVIWQIIRRDNYNHERMLSQLDKFGTNVSLNSHYANDVKVYFNEVYNFRKYDKNYKNILTNREISLLTKRN